MRHYDHTHHRHDRDLHSVRTPRSALASSVLALALLGCQGQAVDNASSVEFIEHHIANYRVVVPAAYASDTSILDDAYELIENTEGMLAARPGLVPTNMEPIEIAFVGKRATVEREAIQPVTDEGATTLEDKSEGTTTTSMGGSPITAFSAFKPNTGNEFKMQVPDMLRMSIGHDAIARGEMHGNPDPQGRYLGQPDAPDAIIAATSAKSGDIDKGWSNNHDSRMLIGSVNTAITSWPWRAITHFSNTCSGALVGPRHVVTAAHCINRSGDDDFYGFTVRTERNGTAWLGSSSMPGCPNGVCPNNGQTYWYFTPWQWREPSTSNREQYDFGIIVLPNRLGDQTGWMGWWYASMGALNTVSKYSRGYPSCDASTSSGVERIDDPADPNKCATCTTDLTTCNARHMYGDSFSCNVGEGTNLVDGWNRNFKMTCDGSAGMSGSPLYFYGDGSVGEDGSVYYTAHDIQSTCGATANDSSCANVARADRLLRLTPEYADWISYFRAQFP